MNDKKYNRFVKSAKKAVIRIIIYTLVSMYSSMVACCLFVSFDTISGYKSEIAYAEKYKEAPGFDYDKVIKQAESLEKSQKSQSLYCFCKENECTATLIMFAFFLIPLFFIYRIYQECNSILAQLKPIFKFYSELKRKLNEDYEELLGKKRS